MMEEEDFDSIVIVLPKEPYFEWMRERGASAEEIESARRAGRCFYTEHRDAFQSSGQYHEYISSYKPLIFCEMLSRWKTEEETWPSEDFTADFFDTWFDIRYGMAISMLEDLADEDEEDCRDEEDFIDPTDYPELDDDDLCGDDDLHSAMMELLDEQMQNNSPPQTKETFTRLLSEGFAEDEVRRLIALAIAEGLLKMAQSGKDFDMATYIDRLSGLPSTPWIGE